MDTRTLIGGGAAVVILAMIAYMAWQFTHQPTTQQADVAPFSMSATYLCANNKIFAAGFSDGVAVIVFDDGRSLTLEQTEAASGARYANEGDTIVFSTKGQGAFVEENGEIAYRDCIMQNDEAVDGQKFDDSVLPIGGEEPVRDQGSTSTTNTCYVGGCSGQICSDTPDIVTTCEWSEAYACYRTARCERQKSGVCGWTQTPELQQCLSNSFDDTVIPQAL